MMNNASKHGARTMPRAARALPSNEPAAPVRRWTAGLVAWFRRPRLDARHASLARAVDHADLEYRMRQWDDAERLDRMPR